MERKLLDLTEVGQQLGVCRGTIISLIRRGELPARQIGLKWKIYQDELDEYLRLAEEKVKKLVASR